MPDNLIKKSLLLSLPVQMLIIYSLYINGIRYIDFEASVVLILISLSGIIAGGILTILYELSKKLITKIKHDRAYKELDQVKVLKEQGVFSDAEYTKAVDRIKNKLQF